MSAYLVYLCQGVNDRDELEKYWEEVTDTFAGIDIKILSAYAAQEQLEGEGPVEGVVICEFPSMETAKTWYNGSAYTEVRQHRLRGAKYIGLLVDGEFTQTWRTGCPRLSTTDPELTQKASAGQCHFTITVAGEVTPLGTAFRASRR